jgi:hypothetical protein
MVGQVGAPVDTAVVVVEGGAVADGPVVADGAVVAADVGLAVWLAPDPQPATVTPTINSPITKDHLLFMATPYASDRGAQSSDPRAAQTSVVAG